MRRSVPEIERRASEDVAAGYYLLRLRPRALLFFAAALLAPVRFLTADRARIGGTISL